MGLTGCSDESQSLAPGAIHEVCTLLLKGESLEYRFEASAPLDFNIHYHTDHEIHYPLRVDAVRMRAGRFVAAEGQNYCLMWSNLSTLPVELTVAIDPD